MCATSEGRCGVRAADKSEQNAEQQFWKWAHGVIQPLKPWRGKPDQRWLRDTYISASGGWSASFASSALGSLKRLAFRMDTLRKFESSHPPLKK
jgi:hypothetical protein